MTTQPFFNNSYGLGIEGFLNYSNILVEGWLVNLFVTFVFFASLLTLSKSEWSAPGVSAFSFFIALITALLFKLFTAVNEMLIFILAIGLALSIGWGLISRGS